LVQNGIDQIGRCISGLWKQFQHRRLIEKYSNKSLRCSEFQGLGQPLQSRWNVAYLLITAREQELDLHAGPGSSFVSRSIQQRLQYGWDLLIVPAHEEITDQRKFCILELGIKPAGSIGFGPLIDSLPIPKNELHAGLVSDRDRIEPLHGISRHDSIHLIYGV
jgi:hypothetical protein